MRKLLAYLQLQYHEYENCFQHQIHSVNIKKISENIKSDVITSKMVSISETNNLQITNHMPCWDIVDSL